MADFASQKNFFGVLWRTKLSAGHIRTEKIIPTKRSKIIERAKLYNLWRDASRKHCSCRSLL